MLGDTNTRYFDGVVIIKRKKNSYDLLNEEDGNFITDQNVLENLVTIITKITLRAINIWSFFAHIRAFLG